MKAFIFALFLMIPLIGTSQQVEPVKTQCIGKKANGEQCSRKQTKTHCWQHDPQAIRCKVPTKGGTPCKRIVKKEGEHCTQHQ